MTSLPGPPPAVAGSSWRPRRLATEWSSAAPARTSSPAWSIGATAAVVAMAVTATGDVVLAGVLLVVAARDGSVGPAVLLAGVASLARWGTPSLAAIGADQAVLGIAGAVGPTLAAASAWCTAAALVAAPRPRASHAALASGTVAALLVAGPTDVDGWWVRLVSTVAAVASAWAIDRAVTRGGHTVHRVAVAVSAVLGLAALVLAIAA